MLYVFLNFNTPVSCNQLHLFLKNFQKLGFFLFGCFLVEESFAARILGVLFSFHLNYDEHLSVNTLIFNTRK